MSAGKPVKAEIKCIWIQNGKDGLYSDAEKAAILAGSVKARAVKGTCFLVTASYFDQAGVELVDTDFVVQGIDDEIYFLTNLDGEDVSSGPDGAAAAGSAGCNLRINFNARGIPYENKSVVVKAALKKPEEKNPYLVSSNSVQISFA